MSLEACYAQLGGDLEDVRSRLVTDERIIKFIGIFEQSPLFDNLQKALDEGNMEEAFRAAHTMKGNSRDMGFMPLYEASWMRSRRSDKREKGCRALRAEEKGHSAYDGNGGSE